MSENGQAEWFYVGHYGQLGPLTLQNLVELATDGVIERDTYVWNPSMPDWSAAETIPQLMSVFGKAPTQPPPPPSARPHGFQPPSTPSPSPYKPVDGYAAAMSPYGSSQWALSGFSTPRSDKNRLTAALLNVIPGVGRLYLGHSAIGILQLFTGFCFGVGFLWAWIDALYILAGGLKHDGYGRELAD